MTQFKILEHTIPGQHIREYPNATQNRQEDVFQIAIKQYVPIRDSEPGKDAVTIIGGHANGFPKEMYEPLWDELLQRSREQGFEIRGVWIADTSNSGVSGVLNECIQGDDPSWFDHSRDLLSMINHFRDQMPRPIVGVAHSLGCAQLVNLSLMHPRLLSTLVLIEPVIQPGPAPGPIAAMMSTFRPDLWPSRKAAEAAFRKNKFFQTWDKRVLDKYLQFGLRQVPTALYPTSTESPNMNPEAVTLSTTKHQEVWTYVRSNFSPQDPERDRLISPDLDSADQLRFPFTRAEANIIYNNLQHLRPSVLWIWGETSNLHSPEWEAQKMSLTGSGVGGSGGAKVGKVQRIIINGHGHMVPCEKVRECAEYAADWLGEWFKEYKADEEFYQNHVNGRSTNGMLMVSEEWKKRVKQPISVTRPVKGKL